MPRFRHPLLNDEFREGTLLAVMSGTAEPLNLWKRQLHQVVLIT